MDRYPNISDHGLIGDLRTAALVSTDGTVDWFCCPRFDSPSVFASLLDADKGEYFRITPGSSDYVSRAGVAPARCASATAPLTSSSSTSTARRWTPSSTRTHAAWEWRTRAG
jgi:hypothetical protein